MAGFRNRFIHGVGTFAGGLPTSWLLKLSGKRTFLPFYHAISDFELPHIKHLYRVKNVTQFETDLDYLLKYFDVIDYQQFVKQSINHNTQKKSSFLLSFDDGLKEFYEVIAPILIKKGVPAMCFLNSDFVDNKALFYRYKASLLIEELVQNPSKLQLLKTILDQSSPWSNQLLSVNYQNREVLDQMAELIEFEFADFLKNQKPYLTSEQIRSLIKQGFTFGGHSVDHPVFKTITLENQLTQTRESVDFVANTFGLDYRIFSFPFTDFGVSKSFFDTVQKEGIAQNTFGSAGLKSDQAAINHQRIALEMEQLSAQQIIQSELLYSMVRMPFGKNVISRSDAI